MRGGEPNRVREREAIDTRRGVIEAKMQQMEGGTRKVTACLRVECDNCDVGG